MNMFGITNFYLKIFDNKQKVIVKFTHFFTNI